MSIDQKLVGLVVQVSMVLTLYGLYRTGHWRKCWSLVPYCVAILICGGLTIWWPAQFHTWSFWAFKQTVYDAIKLGLAAEIAWRVCGSHPKARTVLGRWSIAGLLALSAALVIQPWKPDLLTTIGELHGRAVIAALFLLTSTLGVAAHYRLRVEHFHSLLMVGFSFYLALFGALLRMMLVSGPAVAHPYWRAIDPPAYALFSCWLAFVAWNSNGAAKAARKAA
jgi:hypothetical protein